MKDYQQVIEERYNVENESLKSIYDADQPIGKYSRQTIFPVISRMLKKSSEGIPASECRILDVGCGNGGMIEFMMSIGFNSRNISGVDMSATRIELAKKKYPEIDFICDNGLTFNTGEKYDIITSFDMFSHITREEEIIRGFENIHSHLTENGVFLWYDIFSRDHYDSPANIESWGFSAEQMKDLGLKAGFKVTETKTFFKNFFGKYNSLYQARRFPFPLIRLMEKIVPGTPGNIAMTFRKL